MKARFSEVMKPPKQEKTKPQSSEEIINNIKKKVRGY